MARPEQVVVVDLDGTLANVEHRRHFIKTRPKDWVGFHRACVRDTPNAWCVELIRCLQKAGIPVYIVTARSIAVIDETRAWLRDHLGDTSGIELVMLRPEGQLTKDVELKRKWLHEFGRRRVLFAVDDRARVVRMWREEKIVCLQCDDWEERETEEPVAARFPRGPGSTGPRRRPRGVR